MLCHHRSPPPSPLPHLCAMLDSLLISTHHAVWCVSLFIMTTGGEVVIEKHWRVKVPRSVADDFYTEHVVPPAGTGRRYCYVHVLHRDLMFVAVVTQEAPCFMVLEMLHKVVDTLERYFGQLSDETVRDNFVVTYTLLEETIDDGFPMTFEPALLRDLELHAVLDKEGKAVCAEVMGHIETNCRLTGMPDILVQFNNPDCMDD
eukprot:gene31760-49095_t